MKATAPISAVTPVLSVNAECKCVGKNEFILENYIITFKSHVILRTGLNPQLTAFAKKGETQHIDDNSGWANKIGIPLTEIKESKQKLIRFTSGYFCREAARQFLFDELGNSMRDAVNASNRFYDDSGLHTWRGQIP